MLASRRNHQDLVDTVIEPVLGKHFAALLSPNDIDAFLRTEHDQPTADLGPRDLPG